MVKEYNKYPYTLRVDPPILNILPHLLFFFAESFQSERCQNISVFTSCIFLCDVSTIIRLKKVNCDSRILSKVRIELSIYCLCIFGFGCAGSLLPCRPFFSGCRAWASYCSGFSCCGARALGRSSFRSCSAWTQQLRLLGCRAADSVVAAHRLSCSTTCGTFPGKGSNRCLLHSVAHSSS